MIEGKLLNLLRYLYSKTPRVIKFGPKYYFTYVKTKMLLYKSDLWSEEKQEKFKNKKLSKLLKYSYKNVPYYHKLFKEIEFNPYNFSQEDFRKIPVLTKELIRENQKDLISKKFKINQLHQIKTGGTTGIPLQIYEKKSYSLAREDAFVEHIYRRIGYKASGKKVVFRDNQFINNSINIEQKIFWKYHVGRKELWFSVRHLTKDNIGLYIEKMNSFNPEWIIGYPHAIYMICKKLHNISENNMNVKGIIFMSENLYDSQLNLINKTFPKSKTVSVYGHTERGVIAGTCEENMDYHIQYQYGHVEFLSDGDFSEIVTTGYNNYAMPLIRYKTGDLGTTSSTKCLCGRHLKVIKHLDGRLQCALYGRNGKFISDNSLDFPDALPYIFDKIHQYQFYQDKIGYCIMKIIVSDDFKREYIEELSKYVSNQFENEIHVDIEVVEFIEKTKRGKHRIVINNIPENDIDSLSERSHE